MKCAVSALTSKTIALLFALLLLSTAAAATPIQIYGAWHCSNDACTWGTVRNLTDFDAKDRKSVV